MIAPGVVVDERYRIVGLLAQGGMADVFKAHDVRLNRDVALKAFRVGASDVRRFRLETQLLARFDHPNLVRVLDAGDVEEQPYLVLELVDGPTLAHRLRSGPLSQTEAHRLGTDLSAALARVHAARIVHRDVKPANILLAPDGRAQLGDFGIALLLDATRLTAASHVAGTAAYLAPEQVSGGPVTAAADIYSLGLVLMEALTGRAPFAGTPQEVMAARLARPPAVPPDLPRPWPQLLAEMTDVDPERRPSAETVHARLRTPDAAPTVVAASTVVGAPPTEILARAAPPRTRRTASRVGLAAAAVVGTLVLVGLLAQADDRDAEAPPATDVSGTTSATTATTATPTTAIPPTSPPTTQRPAVTCAQFEAAKRAVELQKQRVEQQYRDDASRREQLKQELEDQKRSIEAEKKAARC